MQASLPDRPIGADLSVASIASMVEDAGGVFTAMGDAVLQAADETERLGTIELAKANPQTQILARWLKTQHFMQRWLGMSFGVTYGEDHMEFYALVNELIEDWMIPMEPWKAIRVGIYSARGLRLDKGNGQVYQTRYL